MVRGVTVNADMCLQFRHCNISFNSDYSGFSFRKSCIWPLQGIEEALPRNLRGHLGKLRHTWAETQKHRVQSWWRDGFCQKRVQPATSTEINTVFNPLGSDSEKGKLISLVWKCIRIWLSKQWDSFAPHCWLPKINNFLTGRHGGMWELFTQVSKAFLK